MKTHPDPLQLPQPAFLKCLFFEGGIRIRASGVAEVEHSNEVRSEGREMNESYPQQSPLVNKREKCLL
jgi:hypothetical protein